MNKEFIEKITRIFIVILSLMCLTVIVGVAQREAHQFFYMLGIMILFGLFLKNIWITLFLWWTVFLFTFFKFNLGYIYIQNIFYGCILYFLIKTVYKSEHIDFFINCLLWLLVANLLYGILQILGLDFIYMGRESISGSFHHPLIDETRRFIGQLDVKRVPAPMGFMSNTTFMAALITICMPLMMTRPNKYSLWIGTALFIPLWILHSFMAMIGAIIAYMFILWYRINRKIWIGILILILLGGSIFSIKVDKPGIERICMWKLALHDCIIHPITGWGLDSFRRVTKNKPHIYARKYVSASKEKKEELEYWDNPHNLYISLFFEWGFPALFLLCGYLRQCYLWFKNAIKDRNLLGLTGCIITILIISGASHIMFLARMIVIIIPVFALFETKCRNVRM